jgi:hypothetical protein
VELWFVLAAETAAKPEVEKIFCVRDRMRRYVKELEDVLRRRIVKLRSCR